MTDKIRTFVIDRLTGLDDSIPPTGIADNACTLAENVEFYRSTLGERRAGCEPQGLNSTLRADMTVTRVPWMFRHLPTADETQAELFVVLDNPSTSDYVFAVLRSGSEAIYNNAQIEINTADNNAFFVDAAVLHGKLFISYKNVGGLLAEPDRISLFTSSGVFRSAGLDPIPGTPLTATNTGSGSFSGTRYYRVRLTLQTSGVTELRSEPTDSVSFVPSGSGAGASISVGTPRAWSAATHWELEASLDNSTFYRIETLSIVTTTTTDSTAYATGYSVSGTLSEDIGDYSLIPSGKLLRVDEDRLLILGSWEDVASASRITWTPVGGGPGVGNDERLETDTDPFLDLDGFEGGEITDASLVSNGYLYVFKRAHIYKLARTGERDKAYEAIPITKTKGAFPKSVITAVDEKGFPVTYFLDPDTGPMRLGQDGLQWCGKDIRTYWSTVNKNADVPCHGVYYKDKDQIHWWIATEESDYPNTKIVLQLDLMRLTEDGLRGGWSTVPSTDRIAQATSSVMWSSHVYAGSPGSTYFFGDRSLDLIPFIGLNDYSVSGTPTRSMIQRCDTGTVDGDEADTDNEYFARVRTKPFMFSGILDKHGIMTGAVMAEANADDAQLLYVKGIRDFGAEELEISTDMVPEGSEDYVIKPLDDFNFSELTAVQIEFGDLGDEPADEWAVSQIGLKIRSEQTS